MHTCPVPNCEIDVPPHLLMCNKHWRLVPCPIQRRVWNAWKNMDREAHLAATRQAVAAVKERLAAAECQTQLAL